MPEPSQCQRVLAVLSDHRPHTITEIHERAGTMRLNSRVAELRSRGHVIKCWSTRTRNGSGRLRAVYWYRLEAALPQAGVTPSVPACGSASAGVDQPVLTSSALLQREGGAELVLSGPSPVLVRRRSAPQSESLFDEATAA